MALDAATLSLTAAELKTALAEARIDKIFQPTRDEVIFAMHSRTASFRLLLSARSGSARVCLTSEIYENPAVPPTFCMLLRKHFSGGRLLDIRTLPGERIVFFDFVCTNEMGDQVQNTLAAELMGRYSNLVLIANGSFEPEKETLLAGGRVLDALKRIGFDDSEIRQLLPGLPYTLPPRPATLSLMEAPFEEILRAIVALEMPLVDALRKTCGGIGPVVCREVCTRAFGAREVLSNSLVAEDTKALKAALQNIREEWRAGGLPNLVQKPDGHPVEFSFVRLTQYLPLCRVVEFPTFSGLLEGYYAQKDKAERLRQKSHQLRKNLQNIYDRALRKQSARKEELAESEQSDHLRIAGELLTANLHSFKKGDTQIKLDNWYTGAQQVIQLDIRLAPSANAQKYFKEYKKKQTAVNMLRKLLESGEKEIGYLQTVLYEVDSAQGESELVEIRAELKEQGYLKNYKQRDKKQKPLGFLRYTSRDGFSILVGRNNLQNERLTLKTARGKDLWFHVKNAPGSHVVVLSGGRDIPLATQNQAAMLAVVHSSLKNGDKVPVDYTEVKNIRKTGDLPPGMVLYEHYETGYITPEETQLPALEDNA